MTTPQPRIREIYREYALGRIPFETVVRAADEFLERFERRRQSGGTSAGDSGEPGDRRP